MRDGYRAAMTRRSLAALAALATLSVPAVAVATDDWCPPEDTTTTTSTTAVSTTTSVPVASSTSVPASDPGAPETTAPAPTTTAPPTAPSTTVPGPVVDPIPEPQPPLEERCLDPDGDGVGTWRLAVAPCFLTPEAELWHTVIWSMVATYGISPALANVLLIRLLTS